MIRLWIPSGEQSRPAEFLWVSAASEKQNHPTLPLNIIDARAAKRVAGFFIFLSRNLVLRARRQNSRAQYLHQQRGSFYSNSADSTFEVFGGSLSAPILTIQPNGEIFIF
jgi:hypothetical protein